jgi:hypothetical protein
MNPKVARTVPAVLEEVNDLLTGRARIAAAQVAEASGQPPSVTPNADLLRDVRDALKQALFTEGNPKRGIKDGLSNTEAKILKAMFDKSQALFKELPEAKKADMLYAKASNYAKLAQKNLFRPDGNGGKEISNAAVESFVMGKGAAGKVEDLDRMFSRRKEFVDALERPWARRAR